ncbi:Uncharacterised protein [Enterobacter cloacae]|uniref:Uncharacterized protein n=1 Tax=Enterobacter cloacae TaxID=550 RepID=A0A377LMS2_ENTCL|nr:Uncharacterised protein [Enterobacter cloacae]
MNIACKWFVPSVPATAISIVLTSASPLLKTSGPWFTFIPRPDSFVSFLTDELSRRGRKYLWDQQNWQNDLNLLIRDLKELLIIRRISEEVHLTLDEKFRQESQAQTDGRFLEMLLTYSPALPTECVALQLVRYISAFPQETRSAVAGVVTMIFRHLPYPETLKESFLLDPELRERYCHPDQDPGSAMPFISLTSCNYTFELRL